MSNRRKPAPEPVEEEKELLDREKLAEEFEIIRKASKDGLLHPEKAVSWARNNRNSELHRHLEWDDSAAAERFREDQIRGLIRVVIKPSNETGKSVRAYISRPSDRITGGGYAPVEAALAKARLELINEATRSISMMKSRYTHLPELDTLFVEIDATIARFTEALGQSRVAG